MALAVGSPEWRDLPPVVKRDRATWYDGRLSFEVFDTRFGAERIAKASGVSAVSYRRRSA